MIIIRTSADLISNETVPLRNGHSVSWRDWLESMGKGLGAADILEQFCVALLQVSKAFTGLGILPLRFVAFMGF